jgi:hypothetical protein
LLDAEQRMTFFSSSDGLTGADVIKKARELLVASESHGEYYVDGGEFLPLSVWGRRGFDENNIMMRSLKSDVREDRVLGTIYRVKILSTGNKGEATTTRSTVCKRKSKALPAPQDQSSSSRPRLALEDGSAADASTPHASSDEGSSSSPSDSSDTSSSSSSSSAKHKKKSKKGKKGKTGKKEKKVKKEKKLKKGKKDKKGKKGKNDKKGKKDARPETELEKKARLALERAQAKEASKRLLANSKAAEAVLAKVGGIIIALGAILEKENMNMVAPLIRDPLSTHLANFEALKSNAESVLLAGGEGELDINDIKDLVKQIAEAKKAIALATQMLATLARAPGA